MKSLDDHIKAFVFNIGKYKDEKLVDVTDLDWLDWFVKSEYASDWQKKLVNKYIDGIANSIREKEDKNSQDLYEELKDGSWVDENF